MARVPLGTAAGIALSQISFSDYTLVFFCFTTSQRKLLHLNKVETCMR